MKKILVLLLAITAFSCSKEYNSVNIRLKNVSSYNYQNIVINTSAGEVKYSDLNSKQASNYKEFEKAYRYAFVQLSIDGTTYTYQPIDYVGESPLENGNYTYEINTNIHSPQSIVLNLKRD